MILVFGSSIFEQDGQNNILLDVLARSGKEFVFINPLNPTDLARVELSQHKDKLLLAIDGKEIKTRTVYMERLWRTDCIVNIPESCSYPTLFRHKVHDFLTDIRFVVEASKWIPGKYNSIERGESKVALMQTALACDLLVPAITLNSFTDHFVDIKYRKVLGPPFTVTHDSKESQEVVTTLLNSKAGGEEDGGLVGLPWQWQSPVTTVAQIRCVVVGTQIRCYRAEIDQFKGRSLREAQGDEQEILWKLDTLPPSVATSLLKLCTALELSMCCPEFLIDEKGQYIFIDLNPCGDWYGFIDQEENLLVANMIVGML